jgi:outer membrane protein assembly factor BamB
MRTRHGVALAGLLTAALGAMAAGSGGPALAAPPAWADAPSWTRDGYGPGNGGYNPSETWIVPGRTGRLAEQWSITTTGQEVCARQAAPVVSDGRLYLAGRESLGAYDAATGKSLWSYPYEDPMDTHTPILAVSGGTLLAGTWGCQSVSDPDGELLALNAATGALRWKASTDAPDSVLAVDRGVAVVGGQDAGWMGTTAFRISTGERLWERPQAMPAAGVSADGRLLLTDHDRTFAPNGALEVDISTGKVGWKTRQIWSVEAADPTGHFFLVGDEAGALLRVDAATGAIAWSQPGMAGPLAVDDRHVYVATGTRLLSLDAGSGRPAWRRGGYDSLLRPVVAGGVLYTGTPKKRLESLNAANGRRLGFTATDPPIDHPVITGDWLYLTDGTRLRAYTVPRIGCCPGPGVPG